MDINCVENVCESNSNFASACLGDREKDSGLSCSDCDVLSAQSGKLYHCDSSILLCETEGLKFRRNNQMCSEDKHKIVRTSSSGNNSSTDKEQNLKEDNFTISIEIKVCTF